MDPLTLKVILDKPDAKLPVYQTGRASGADLFSVDECTIHPGCSELIDTGLKFEIPFGYEVQIRSRSGLAAKNKIFVLNGIGTIDNDYQGPIKVILMNLSTQSFTVKKGDRVAQMVISPIQQCSFEVTLKVEAVSTRGENGFGSTGI